MQEVVGRVVVSAQSAPFRALCGHYQRREAKFVVLAQERVGLGRSLAVGSGTTGHATRLAYRACIQYSTHEEVRCYISHGVQYSAMPRVR